MKFYLLFFLPVYCALFSYEQAHLFYKKTGKLETIFASAANGLTGIIVKDQIPIGVTTSQPPFQQKRSLLQYRSVIVNYLIYEII